MSRAVLALTFGLLAPASLPSQALPGPSGGLPIGTTVLRLEDSSRADLVRADLPRAVTVQLWYPAPRPAAGSEGAPYLLEPALLATLLATGYYSQDSALLRGWGALRTHASLNAAPAPGTRHPLLFFSHGLGVARANYTTLVEDLASHGYVVALVDHPYGGETITGGGRHLSANSDPADLNDVDTLTARTVDWSGDLSFLLDRLPMVRDPIARAVIGSIDFRRIGATGHSMGGVAALEWCYRDPRPRACADLDGFPTTPDGTGWTSIVGAGVRKPSLILRSEPVYSDSELIAKGRTREGWNKGAAVTAALWDSIAVRSRAPFLVAGVRGTGHFSYSDGPFVMPSTITRFGGRIIEWDRGREIINTALRAWFDDALNDRRPRTLLALPTRYPEFTVARIARLP